MDYLFFQKLNSLAGQWFWIDTLVIFCADFLIWFLPIFIVLFYFLSSLARKEKYRRYLPQAILIVGLAWLLSQLIGLIYFRERPYQAHAVLSQLVTTYSDKSFPSDHTTLAAALAFAVMLFDKRLGILLFIFALFIGVARIIGGVHYPLDVLGGFLVAGLSTFLIVKFFKFVKIK